MINLERTAAPTGYETLGIAPGTPVAHSKFDFVMQKARHDDEASPLTRMARVTTA